MSVALKKWYISFDVQCIFNIYYELLAIYYNCYLNNGFNVLHKIALFTNILSTLDRHFQWNF